MFTEEEYKIKLAKVFRPISDSLNTIKEKEIDDFFEVILDAAERSLRGILFNTPEEFNFNKTVVEEEIDFWLHKVSLALVAYSYYFFSIKEQPQVGQLSFEKYWQRMFETYNVVFNENINIDDINHYACGLKEDTEKGYSGVGNMVKVAELAEKDYKTIGSELLSGIWKEKNSLDERKKLILGVRIWKAYQQIVQPFLPKLLTDY